MRLFGFLWRKTELSEELESHLRMAVADRVARGDSAAEARRAVMREFGNLPLIADVTRERWGWLRLERLMQDVRFAARQLRRTPAFTITVLLTLALGIGANAAIFTLVNSILLRDLPVANPKTLVHLGNDGHDCCVGFNGARKNGNYSNFSTDTYEQVKKNVPEFEELAAMQAGWGYGPIIARRDGAQAAPSVMGEFVSGDYLRTIGLRPAAGRLWIAPALADVDLGAGPAHCLCKYREPVAGERHGQAGRDVGADRAGSNAWPDRSSTPDGEHPARRPGRASGLGRGLRWYADADPACIPWRAICSDRCEAVAGSFGVCVGAVDADVGPLWSAPAWIAAQARPADALRSGTWTTVAGTSLPQRTLVVLQAALSLVLLVGAGLFSQSLDNLHNTDLKLDTRNRYVAHINPQAAGYSPTKLEALYRTMEERFHAIPGVLKVGISTYAPMEDNRWNNGIGVQGHPEVHGLACIVKVNGDYFDFRPMHSMSAN